MDITFNNINYIFGGTCDIVSNFPDSAIPFRFYGISIIRMFTSITSFNTSIETWFYAYFTN